MDTASDKPLPGVPHPASAGLSADHVVDLLDAAGQIIVALAPDATVSFINRRGAELLGWENSDLIGRDWFDSCVPEEVRETVREVFRCASAGTDFTEQYDNDVIKRSGELRRFTWRNTTVRDAEGKFLNTLSFGRDVTNEQETERLAGRLASIIEVTPDLVGTATADGTVTYLNAAARAAFGVDDGADLSAINHKTFYPEDAARLVMDVAVPAALTDGHWEGLNTLLLADGSQIPVSQVIIAHTGGDDTQLFSTVIRDISALAASEHRVSLLNERLNRVNVRLRTSLDTQKRFIANVSHELRTPLNSIIGFTGIMRDGHAGPLTDEQTRQLGMVYNSGQQLLALIDDILEMSSIQAGTLRCEPESFDARELMESLLGSVGPLARERGLELTVSYPEGDTAVLQDRAKVERIWYQLLRNAVKYTSSGRIDVRLEVSDGLLRVDIADTGIGIPAEELPHVFDSFRQARRTDVAKSDGTGLGLAICQALAEIVHGTVTATSTEGVGSTFTFAAPAVLRPEDCS